jgi:hypothetical protein
LRQHGAVLFRADPEWLSVELNGVTLTLLTL